jgi:hypothetical protein
MGGKTKGFIEPKDLGGRCVRYGRIGGFAKVDNRFGNEKWIQGESIGVVTYETKKKGKICFVIYIAGERFFFIYDVLVKQFF